MRGGEERGGKEVTLTHLIKGQRAVPVSCECPAAPLPLSPTALHEEEVAQSASGPHTHTYMHTCTDSPLK